MITKIVMTVIKSTLMAVETTASQAFAVTVFSESMARIVKRVMMETPTMEMVAPLNVFWNYAAMVKSIKAKTVTITMLKTP